MVAKIARRGLKMRRCILHIGTHKTGTTSIQKTLAGHGAALARHGFFYPETGIPQGENFGQHYVAWDLIGDEEFRPIFGAADRLLREIDASDRDIVISSEDLETAIWHRQRFGDFVGELRRRGIEVTIVVYLRNQLDYVRSLYLQLITRKYEGGFAGFADGILAARALRWQWRVISFCYRDLLAQLPADTRIVVRSYERAGAVTADFAGVLGLTLADLGIVGEPRENPRLSVSKAFALYFKRLTGRDLEAGIVSALALAFDGAGIAVATRDRLIAAFDASNREVERRYGVSGLADPRTDCLGPARGPSFETIFSDDMVRRVAALTPARAAAFDLLGKK